MIKYKRATMNFAVIEGLDGSGKSTQINLLRDYLKEKAVPFQYVHFPRTHTGIYGDLVARFLRGELGAIQEVDPYLVALIYAGDRQDAANEIRKWLQEGYFVLVDRYVYSNIAFQCAKMSNLQDREKLKEWIIHLEYEHHNIPRPGLNIFLDVPFSFTQAQLKEGRSGDDRHYLQGKNDIHEQNLDFQKNVRDVYLSLKGEDKYNIISCYDENEAMLEPDQIFSKIIKLFFENEIY